MNIRPETIKLLEENIGGTLLDISVGAGFLKSDPKIKSNKSKSETTSYLKGNINEMRR